MLKRLWIWWNKVRFSFSPLKVEQIMMAQDYKEIVSSRDKQTRSRVAAAFKEQQQEMQARALKAHQCEDPAFCEKDICFIYEPDKIVPKRGRPRRILITPKK